MTDLEKTRTDLQIDQLVEAFRNDLTSRSIAIAKKATVSHSTLATWR